MKKILSILATIALIVNFAFAQQPVHKKKDGTPDKRYKENKVKPPVHVKQDGTPDKRFKENKAPKPPAKKKTH